MKRLLGALVFSLMACGASAYANQLDGLSMGLSTGTKDGLSVAYQPDFKMLYQAKLSMEEVSTDMNGDILFLLPEVTRSFGLVPYYGLGMSYTRFHDREPVILNGEEVEVSTGERQAIGLRVPVGLLLKMPTMPVEIGMEAAAHVGAYPRTKTTLDTAMNIRLVL